MEKIKEFFKNFYSNKKLFWGVVGGAAALLVILGVVLALVLGGSGATGGQLTGCTVTVKTEAGMPLKDIGVYVYTDATKEEMVSFAKTDEKGVATITEAVPAGSVAVLDGVTAGFVVEETYPITAADTQIALSIELLKEMAPIALGGVMFDFTVTDTDGNEYTLSELLEQKDAVVLNFWYTNCGPCKAEFPFLQKAYEQYSDSIALLALNPAAEDDETAIKTFKTDNALTFPMAKVDAVWAEQISGIAYPTTVIIDRYGLVTLIHVGGIDDTKTFADAFAHFTDEAYVQATVENIYSLNSGAADAQPGTKENPLVPENPAEFSVEVPAGETVYYNLGAASGNVLEVSSETVKITCGSLTLEPVEGIVKMMLIGAEDGSAPILVGFTNTGAEAQTYKVATAKAEGGKDNPIVMMKLGDEIADVVAGNVPGVYYTYTVTEDGNFTVTVKDGDNESKFDIALSNEDSGKTTLLSADGVADEKAKTTSVSVAASKGDTVKLTVTVAADEKGCCNAAQIKFNTAVVKEESSGGNQGGSSSGNTGGGSSSGGNSGGGNSGGSTGGANYNGTLVNPDEPVEQYGFNDFEIEVGGGEKKLVNMIRLINKATLRISDKNAYVVYDGTTYKPNSSGVVSFVIESEGTNTPVILEIGNSGTSNKTFDVVFLFAKGTRENPGKLEIGQNTIKCESGNDQGTFYAFKPSKDGTLKLELSGVPSNVVVGVSVNDMAEIPTMVELEEGATSLTITLKAGIEAEIIFSTSDPKREWKIPAAEFTATVSYS